MAEQTKVMAISAHSADFCSRSGGTLIKYARAGAKVKVIWLTHGETEESGFLYEQRPGVSVEEVRRIREEEAFAAAEVVGAEGKMFGFGDDPLRMTLERIEMLAQEIADFDPDVILTHWKDELTHPTHRITSQSAVQAAYLAQRSKADIRFFEPHLGAAARVGFVPEYYVNVSEVFEQKIQALEKLAAQPLLVPMYTICALWRGMENGGKWKGCEYAEAFVRYARQPTLLDSPS